MDKINAKLLNPLTLAYMGDAVLDQHVRTYIVLKLKSKPNKLHQLSKSYVSAKSQAQTLETLMGAKWFTDEELDIVRRGRNAKSYTKAKNTDIQTYKKSTALEAIIGYLYLEGHSERVEQLLTTIVNIVDERA